MTPREAMMIRLLGTLLSPKQPRHYTGRHRATRTLRPMATPTEQRLYPTIAA
jgi:hypothetical protein